MLIALPVAAKAAPTQPPLEGFQFLAQSHHHAAAHQAVIGADDVAEKVRAVGHGAQLTGIA